MLAYFWDWKYPMLRQALHFFYSKNLLGRSWEVSLQKCIERNFFTTCNAQSVTVCFMYFVEACQFLKITASISAFSILVAALFSLLFILADKSTIFQLLWRIIFANRQILFWFAHLVTSLCANDFFFNFKFDVRKRTNIILDYL